VAGPRAGTVVVDTNVFSADLVRSAWSLVELYRPILAGRRYLMSFQTLAEIRFGARRSNWGPYRLSRLEDHLGRAEVVWPGPALLEAYVELRVACERVGHALSGREHDADRRIASTAIHLGIPLVSHDGIFLGTPGLPLDTALPR
jgi:predicted nucleic acid-binding protein